ncbi:MAG: hypothetical protein U5R49_02805 [Deltaproteobacteria bacterium]|nr:hypothetical protein [Deltaproteobacteria bacterium]
MKPPRLNTPMYHLPELHGRQKGTRFNPSTTSAYGAGRGGGQQE